MKKRRRTAVGKTLIFSSVECCLVVPCGGGMAGFLDRFRSSPHPLTDEAHLCR